VAVLAGGFGGAGVLVFVDAGLAVEVTEGSAVFVRVAV